MNAVTFICNICKKFKFYSFQDAQEEKSIKSNLKNKDSIQIKVENKIYENCRDNEYSKSKLECVQNKNFVSDDNKSFNEQEKFKTLNLFPDKYIREDEKDKISFTKEGILKLYEEMNLATDWKIISNKENLTVSCKNGSSIDSNSNVLKTTFIIEKSKFSKEVSLEVLGKIMYEPEHRNTYDIELKEYRIIERGETFYIFYSKVFAPFAFASERDVIDKRIEFIHDKVYYNFASSIESSDIPSKGVLRCKTFMNFLYIKEDENNFIFECCGQFDLKTVIPDKILNVTVHTKTIEWYRKYVDAVNLYLSQENNVENLDSSKRE